MTYNKGLLTHYKTIKLSYSLLCCSGTIKDLVYFQYYTLNESGKTHSAETHFNESFLEENNVFIFYTDVFT